MRNSSPASSSRFHHARAHRAEPTASRPWWRENLEHSLPFLVAGVACLGVAAEFAMTHTHPAGGRPGFWALLAGIGVTLASGGVALTLVDESPTTVSEDDARFVRVDRGEWEAWQRSRNAGPAEEVDEGDAAEAPAPPAPAPPPAPDPALIAQLSAELLAPAPPVPPPVVAAAPASPPRAPSQAPPPAGVPPVPPPAAASAGVRPPPTAQPGPPPPAWSEDPLRELESAIAELQPTRPTPVVVKVPAPKLSPADRCVGCGAPRSSYSEQVCVVCGRPLCDACLEHSVSDGRPSVCPACEVPR